MLALKTWFEQQLTRVSGKSLIAEAIRYGLNHWDGLTRFLDDGRIELDTNIVERGIRPIVLNRKNALFAGHDQGAENWACIASLIETCKLERRRSASLLHRRAHQARQPLARLASRRAHALGLGGRALSKPPSSVTRSQAVKAVRSEGRFPIIRYPRRRRTRTAKRAEFELASSTYSVLNRTRRVAGSYGRSASRGRKPKSACRTLPTTSAGW